MSRVHAQWTEGVALQFEEVEESVLQHSKLLGPLGILLRLRVHPY